MSIQLVCNWKHRLVGWKMTENRERERGGRVWFTLVNCTVQLSHAENPFKVFGKCRT